jgi:hypothetical protein
MSCEFSSINKDTGKPGVARGTCYLTSVYRESKWQLCDSNYLDASGTASPFMR